MLQLRPQQVAVFEEAAERRFADRVVAHLQEQGLADASDLHERVLEAIRDAEARGIATEWDLCRFATHAVRWGPRFYERAELAEAAAVLDDPAMDGREKMHRLDALVGALET